MATLVFSALGTAVGGPLGGMIGALAGRQVDAAIIGSPNRRGPRLKELEATISSYGAALPRYYGRMRVPGTIIWATDLVEQSETQGGGKGTPSLTTYSYTVSFAVALASRPIKGIGQIWADGNLLRGKAGDLKVGGKMRIYTGHGDQEPDPLIAEIEGADRCPAYRGLAYVVFEDLELADYFNRIPALTFEVIADDGFTLQDIVGEIIEDADAKLPLDGLDGFSCEGPLIEALHQLEPMFPLDIDANGDLLTIARERLQTAPIALPEPAISVGDGDFGGGAGYARRRSPVREAPPEVLRYYDVDRDYLPGVQQAPGRPGGGQPHTIELPAALDAATARTFIDRVKRRADWSRDQMVWRTTDLDPAVAFGTIVILPGHSGRWRAATWEWREAGIELTLERLVPTSIEQQVIAKVDPGRLNRVKDLPAPATSLAAFELPWDGTGASDTPAVFAAVSSAGTHWSGAALYCDHGNGELHSLGPSGRTRSVIGCAETILPAANPLLFDRSASVVVVLSGEDMELPDASMRQLALGANKALLGSEIIQFASTAPLGEGRWRLEGLLRGRGGTEAAVAGHQTNERFVLLDPRTIPLDPALVGKAADTMIVAAGRGDPDPVTSEIALRGITTRPLSPVHSRIAALPNGSLHIAWTRRARGAWLWLDSVDAPLHEEAEVYQVTYGPISAPVATWTTDKPELTLSPQVQADLLSRVANGDLFVRQQGSYAFSDPLHLTSISQAH